MTAYQKRIYSSLPITSIHISAKSLNNSLDKHRIYRVEKVDLCTKDLSNALYAQLWRAS